ncbi:ATP-binding cassette domain-containing protein [Paenibacillus chitinolyticus]|uniref:ABC transporter ATP-binding protein n=1 Tax=Paenibacillus chitinolyticus TaxID=79263 RepID=UPI0035DBE3CF
MNIIQVDRIVKEYKTNKRFHGRFGALKTLFSKEYERTKAVNNITFTVAKGESIGYLGPNGAGKSTMIKMMTGILVPSEGNLLVFGLNPHKHRREISKKIGVVFGQRSQLWWDLPVVDSFELHKHIYGISDRDYLNRLEQFTSMFDMAEFLHKPVRQLSLGQRMKAEIALALLHSPEILFLDEPTIGLDVMTKHNIRQFLRKVNVEMNVTILLTTHDLKDIEEICNRILIVNQGSCVFDGTAAELKKLHLGQCSKKIILEFNADPGTITLPHATLFKDEGIRKHFELIPSDNGEPVSITTVLNNLSCVNDIKDISIEDVGIDEVMRAAFVNYSQKDQK